MQEDPYVVGESLGTAYRRQIERYIDDVSACHMTVTCHDPIDVAWNGDSTDIRDWGPYLNVGLEFDDFSEYVFPEESPIEHGSTGEDWINDRIYELQEGFYAERCSDQIEMITERLDHGLHGSSTNALVAQVFDEEDLEKACVPRPNSGGMACVTQLQFHPVKDQLHLYQTLRSQYVDLKGYGNLIAAATLLSKVAAETGYVPGSVIEHVHNVTARSSDAAEEVATSL